MRYAAPSPYPSGNSWLYATFPALFSPSFARSEFLGKLILFSLSRSGPELNTCDFSDPEISVDTGYIETYDGAQLETVEITPSQEFNLPEDQKHYIIEYNGNNALCQDLLDNYVADSKKLASTVVGFNYRGVANSKKDPGTFHELVVDGIAQVQRLLDKGVKPQNITLDGLSLGGAVAVMVAYYFHQKNQKVYLWADRSLASLSKVGAQRYAPKYDGVMGKISFTTTELAMRMIMNTVGWNEDIARAYLSIDPEYRAYLVIAKKSDENRSAGDGCINPQSDLHNGVKAVEKSQGHRTGRKVISYSLWFGGGHCDSRNELVSKANSEITAQQLFEDFVLSHRR